eukprot:TRINITY_DN3579_c0_g1_i8.p1 TRINITY_DN3579_c0_g1~~TRINITY_DN3579_c0_g1_i8.p1  ORF type:complete len:1297 (-),score=227.26 TRINITY_DN3579_c0_g1_i8:844-4707(-)
MATLSSRGHLQPTAALFYLHHLRSCAASARGSQCGSNSSSRGGLPSVWAGSLGMMLKVANVAHELLAALASLLLFLANVMLRVLEVQALELRHQLSPFSYFLSFCAFEVMVQGAVALHHVHALLEQKNSISFGPTQGDATGSEGKRDMHFEGTRTGGQRDANREDAVDMNPGTPPTDGGEADQILCAEGEADQTLCAEGEADQTLCGEGEADQTLCAEGEADQTLCEEEGNEEKSGFTRAQGDETTRVIETDGNSITFQKEEHDSETKRASEQSANNLISQTEGRGSETGHDGEGNDANLTNKVEEAGDADAMSSQTGSLSDGARYNSDEDNFAIPADVNATTVRAYLAQRLVSAVVLGLVLQTFLWPSEPRLCTLSIYIAGGLYAWLLAVRFHCATPFRCRTLSVVLPQLVIGLWMIQHPNILPLGSPGGSSAMACCASLAVANPPFMPTVPSPSTQDGQHSAEEQAETVIRNIQQSMDKEGTGSISLTELVDILDELKSKLDFGDLLRSLLKSESCTVNYQKLITWFYGVARPGESEEQVSKEDLQAVAKKAEEQYREVEKKLDTVSDYAGLSKKAIEEVSLHQGQDKQQPWRHDVVIHHMGLDGLIAVGRDVIKPQFDALVEQLAQTCGAIAHIAPVKGVERSSVKTKVRYGGDASNLSDILRATLEFKLDENGVQKMYEALDYLVFKSKMFGTRVSVTHLVDRFQKPFPGGYRDILCLLRVNGFVCELQMNLDRILEIKEGAGHKQYELVRKVNDELIYAAMKGDQPALLRALFQDGDPTAARDMYDLQALHYAAQHGNALMVKSLLDKKADAFAQDDEGKLAIHRPMLLQHVEVVQLLLTAMQQNPKTLRIKLSGDLTASTLERAPNGFSMPEDLVKSVAAWEAGQLNSKQSLLHCWASCDRAEAMARRQIVDADIVGEPKQKDSEGRTPLDVAILTNSSGAAELLLKEGQHPTQPFLWEKCCSRMTELLQLHCSDCSLGRSIDACRAWSMFQAAKAGNLYVMQAMWLDQHTMVEQQDDRNRNVLHIAAEQHHWHIIDFFCQVMPQLKHHWQFDRKTLCKTSGAYAFIRKDGGVTCWGDAEKGGDSGHLEVTSGVTNICSTDGAFAALRNNGTICCWGQAHHAGHATGKNTFSLAGITTLCSMDHGFAVLTESGTVHTWGSAKRFLWQVQKSFSTNRAFAALKEDGSLHCWGSAVHGGDASKAEAHLTSGVEQVFSTSGAFAALKEDGSLHCWGDAGRGGDASKAAHQWRSERIGWRAETCFFSRCFRLPHKHWCCILLGRQ